MTGLDMLINKALRAAAVACFGLAALAVHAEDVTLRSLDGSTVLTGHLAGFDGENYQLETTIGVLSLGVSQVTCEGADCPELIADLKEFTIAGSNSIGLQVMPAMMEAYAGELGGTLEVEALSPEQVKYTILTPEGENYAAITLNLGDSGEAFTALESGDAVIGLSSRRVTTRERNALLGAGGGDLTNPAQEHILALDGMVITVSPDNPIRTLSLDQISDIFAGNIRNWREVGGGNAAINVYRRDSNAGATQAFETLVMTPTRRALTKTATILGSDAAVSDAVAADPNGIGVASASQERSAKVLTLRTICGQVSSPSEFSIKTEDYPLSRRLFLYTTGGAIPDKAAELIDFLQSDTAQNIVERTGFVSQNVTAASLNDQGRRLAHALMSERDRTSLAALQDMVAGLLDAQRLSLTLRFKSGTVSPDNRAVVDMARLADMVRNGDFDGKQLIILGFADNAGANNENQRLSQARADSVRDILQDADGGRSSVQFTPLGYDNLAPLGCSETEDGRDTNRRVEIWVR